MSSSSQGGSTTTTTSTTTTAAGGGGASSSSAGGGGGCGDTQSDPLDCGKCNAKCGSMNVDALGCVGGACEPYCQVGFFNCDAKPDNGCEQKADAMHCGGCNMGYCSGAMKCMGSICKCMGDPDCSTNMAPGTCNNGVCMCSNNTCKVGENCVKVMGSPACQCNGNPACVGAMDTCCPKVGCKVLDSDTDNCGACGHACPTGFQCTNGKCMCALGACDEGAGVKFSVGCDTMMGFCICNGKTCTALGQRCLSDGTCG